MTRPRRCGISYIENHNSRSISFFKRRAGLYKAAADLSTLTGARVAITLESETGKMSSFGTPSAGPIIDSFLSGHAPVNPFVNEEQKVGITALQNALFRVEKDKFMEDRRNKVTVARAKEIQETSRKAKLVYGKVDDLSVEELNELLHDLTEVDQDIDARLHPQQPSYQLEVGGSSNPLLGRQSSSSTPSQILMPPRRLPWTPIQPSLHHPRPSWSLPQLSRSQSSLLNPFFQPHAQMMLSSTETYQHSYNNTQGVHINGSILQPFSQSSLMSALPPTPFPIEAGLHPVVNPENPCTFTSSHPFANHQCPSPIPSNEPYYDISLLYGLNHSLGDHGGYGGQTAGEHDMPGPSGLHQQAYDCTYRNFLGSSSGESPGDYGTGNNHGDMGHLVGDS
ncbi:hypothetical protein HU200_028025 [Digitaria exilis]|uniref:MADS-box domain-containing protein n=1 Tax=Digitaria exilis TaxID=1010633 RepID=A0A835BTF8_9POAL|nr:hypothetical protein HU200_028025 [Digitaria exilis]